MTYSPAPNTPPTGEDIFSRVGWALRRADLDLQGAKERRLREVGMSSSHYSALVSVETNPGLTGAELARIMGITPQAVALLVGKLTDRGWIERRVHPRHRNVQELHLTSAGRDALTAAESIVSDLERHFRESLGPERYDHLRELLGQVINDLPKWEASQSD